MMRAAATGSRRSTHFTSSTCIPGRALAEPPGWHWPRHAAPGTRPRPACVTPCCRLAPPHLCERDQALLGAYGRDPHSRLLQTLEGRGAGQLELAGHSRQRPLHFMQVRCVCWHRRLAVADRRRRRAPDAGERGAAGGPVPGGQAGGAGWMRERGQAGAQLQPQPVTPCCTPTCSPQCSFPAPALMWPTQTLPG